tara:strand:+ start:2379 stop:2657 length:279 start_codon:yes stop_codon:yes gene_type:complete
MVDNTEDRLTRIEQKVDKLGEAMISMARAEEKITGLKNDYDKMYERMNKLSAKLDDIQYKVDENARTVNLVNKLFWVVIIAAVGSISAQLWM